MTFEQFDKLIAGAIENSAGVLREKNAKYSAGCNPLHNFEVGAAIMGGTPAQAAWGYMTKHLTALRDKIQRNDFDDMEDFQEKITDSINYLLFIYAIGCEERTSKKLLEEALAVPNFAATARAIVEK